ncbi:MAG: GAF domain-containing protein [Nitrospiria bacterium]
MPDEPMRPSMRDEWKPVGPITYERLRPVLQVFSDLAESSEHSDKFLDLLLEQTQKVMGADLLLLFVWDEKKEEWHLVSHRGMPKDFGKNGSIPRAWQSLPSIVLKDGPNLFSNEISKDRRFIGQVIRGMGIHSFAGTTLRSEARVFGSLSIGFSKSDALDASDQEIFLIISHLICPFLLQRMTPPGQTPRLTLSLDPYGRILSSNASFADFLGYEEEKLHKIPLSQFLTSSGRASYSDHFKLVKSGKEKVASFDLEVLKQGAVKGMLAAQLVPQQQGGKGVGFELNAQVVTEIETLEKELLRKNIELGIVESALSALSSSVKEEEVLHGALEKVLSLMDMDGGYLLKLDEKNERLFLAAYRGVAIDTAARPGEQGVRPGEGGIGKIIMKKTPTLLIAEGPKTPLKKRVVGEEGLLSYMGIPVKSAGHPWGILCLFSRNRIFPKDDLEIFNLAGREFGFAIDSVRLFEEMRQRVEDLEIINAVSRSITKSLHPERLLSSIANGLKQMIGASNCYIFSVEDKRNLLFGVAASDQRGGAILKAEFKMNENTVVSLTARERHPFVIENAPHDSRVDKKWIRLFKSRSLFSVPLVNKERIIGVVLLDETRYFRRFSKEEIRRIASLAGQISHAIENATLHQAVQKHLERLQTLSIAIVNIQEEERRRIAKKLKDGAGKDLLNIKNSLEWVEKEIENTDKTLKERLEKMIAQTSKILEGLRKLSHDLRPSILDESGLVPTLKWYIDTYSKQTGTTVHLQTTGTKKRLPARFEILLYRIIQEALTNTAKHAQAESVVISLEKKDIHLHLYITDDGRGFEVRRYFASPPMARRGIGILGMKERVELAGGTFFIDSTPGHGTRISIKVPLVKRGG